MDSPHKKQGRTKTIPKNIIPLESSAQINALRDAFAKNGAISVFGYGVTTKPIVALLNARSFSCTIYDDKLANIKDHNVLDSILESSDKNSKRAAYTNLFLSPSAFCSEDSALEILSPGILPTHPYFAQAHNAISEYDFIYSLLRHKDLLPINNTQNTTPSPIANNPACDCAQDVIPMIWISGTNGKTTTTQMLTFLLAPFGAQAGGNIGTPLATLFSQCARIWILETSSFTLHYTKTAYPKVYLLLPLSQDHISWHNGFENYVDDKLSVLTRMDSTTYALLPNSVRTHRFVRSYLGKAVFYKDSYDLLTYLALDRKALTFDEPFLLDGLVALCGVEMLHKALPKALDKNLDSTKLDSLLDSPAQNTTHDISAYCAHLNTFTIGAHRIEEFYELESDSTKWLWVDDSKGTNIDATLQAIKRYHDRALFLILGGDDKGADCEAIFVLLAELFSNPTPTTTNNPTIAPSVQIFTIGSNEKKLLAFAQQYQINAIQCSILQNAVFSIKNARQNLLALLESSNSTLSKNAIKSTVSEMFVGLLSPAAASLDQFSSYKERGELFKQYVKSSLQPKQ